MDRNKLPKLLRDVDSDVYDDIMIELKAMRDLYPEYRDDQLLVKMLCERKMTARKVKVDFNVQVQPKTFPEPFTTQELLEEYYQILELSRAVSSAVGRISGGELDRLMTRLEVAYARETVHGGLVDVGRNAGKAGAPAKVRKDPRSGQEVDRRQRSGGRPEEGKLSAAGDLCAEESGTEVPKLEKIDQMLMGQTISPRRALRFLIQHVQRLRKEYDEFVS